jgi:hypothetical protein
MDEQQAKEFEAMALKMCPGELLADFDPAQLPCQLLAQFWYSLLRGVRNAA